MTHSLRIASALAAGAAMLAVPMDAVAGTVTANCTGMFNLDIYEIDTERDTQATGKAGVPSPDPLFAPPASDTHTERKGRDRP